MPALQVREFPDDLYEQLKKYAASQRRSVAQQTIIAVEDMLRAAVDDQEHGRQAALRPMYIDFSTEADRAARIEKRKALFADFDKIKWTGPMPTGEDIVRLVREGRDERMGRILGCVGVQAGVGAEAKQGAM